MSFTPDATTDGTLTATITLPCGYAETRTYTTSRGAQAPTFTNSNIAACTSSASFSITPTCGASDYTYTVTGNPGVKFTSNGQQTLTSASTTINLTIASGSSVNSIKARANYQNNISSADASATLTVGAPVIYNSYYNFEGGSSNLNEWNGNFGEENEFCYLGIPTEITTNMNIQGGSATWEKIFPAVFGGIVWDQDGDNLWVAFKSKTYQPVFRITVSNACGSVSKDYKFVPIDCNSAFMISPNPASTEVTVSSDQTKAPPEAQKTFSEVRIYDQQGNLKKRKGYNKVKTGTINVSDLRNGNYWIEIIEGNSKEKKQLLIQR